MSNIIYSWKTRKNGELFTGIMYQYLPLETPDENGSYLKYEQLHAADFNTRAKAKRYAVNMARAYKNKKK